MPFGVLEPVGVGALDDDARVEDDEARVEEGLGEEDAGALDGARDDCPTDDEVGFVDDGTTTAALLLEEGTAEDAGLADDEAPDEVHFPNNGLHPAPQ